MCAQLQASDSEYDGKNDMQTFHSLVFLASPMGSAPQLIDVSRHSDAVERTVIELGSGNVDEDAVISDTSFVYACFDGRPEKSSSGNGRMYFGTDKGMVHVVDGVSHEVVCRVLMPWLFL